VTEKDRKREEENVEIREKQNAQMQIYFGGRLLCSEALT